MKRIASLILLPLVLVTFSPTAANAAAKSGATCKVKGVTEIAQGKKFTCVQSGKKLVWNSGVSVSPAAAPSKPVAPTTTLQPASADYIGAQPAPDHTLKVVSTTGAAIAASQTQSFEIPVAIAPAGSSSNLKIWIYNPADKTKALGSPGIFLQKDGGAWNPYMAKTSDGSMDLKLEPGHYLLDTIEPNGDQKSYSRGRYEVSVATDLSVSIAGLKANSKGYFTLTATLNNLRANQIASFKPTTACQLVDQTGSASMSNGFPRATGRLTNNGIVRALIIPVDFTDLAGAGQPQEAYKEMANGTADFYYKESSHLVKFDFTTLDSYVHLNVPVATFNLGSYNGGDPYGFFMAGLRAAGSKVDISQYDIAYVLPPPSVKMNQIAYGPAFPGRSDSQDYSTDYGRVLNGVAGGADAYQNLVGAKWKWMAHETGHTYGLYDWYTLDGTNPYGSWDLMSMNWSEKAIEFNAWNRYITGWLLDSQVQCQTKESLSSSGQQFSIEAIGKDSLQPKSVMVKLSDSKILVMESRATAGLDIIPANSAGVLIYTVDMKIPTIKGMAKTYLRPGETNLDNAPLHVGDSITIEGVKISVLSVDGLTYKVQVGSA